MLVIGEGPARPWFEEQLPRRDLHRPADRQRSRARAGQRRRVSQSVDHRGVRQRHAGSDGLRACRSIAAEATGATNLVRTGLPERWSTATDADEFADALAAYARDPELAPPPRRGRARVAKTMDWDTINAAVIRAYKHAIVKRERLARMTGR